MPINKVVFGSTTLIDISDTTALASDVALGKYFYALDGTKTAGTASGGGGSVTITDEANATGITCVITTSSEPTPSDIPLNTELINYYSVVSGYYIEGSTGELGVNEGACCTDFTKIDPSMTFSFIAYRWFDLAFYDSSKTYISGNMQDVYKQSTDGEYVHGLIPSAAIPSNAEYIRLTSYPQNPTSSRLSLIRTA